MSAKSKAACGIAAAISKHRKVGKGKSAPKFYGKKFAYRTTK